MQGGFIQYRCRRRTFSFRAVRSTMCMAALKMSCCTVSLQLATALSPKHFSKAYGAVSLISFLMLCVSALPLPVLHSGKATSDMYAFVCNSSTCVSTHVELYPAMDAQRHALMPEYSIYAQERSGASIMVVQHVHHGTTCEQNYPWKALAFSSQSFLRQTVVACLCASRTMVAAACRQLARSEG